MKKETLKNRVFFLTFSPQFFLRLKMNPIKCEYFENKIGRLSTC